MIEINIEGLEPVAKGRPRFSTIGGIVRTHTPKKTVDFENAVKAAAIEQMKKAGSELMDGPVSLFVRFTIGIPESWPKWKRKAASENVIAHTGKPDIDNLIKGVKDALNGVAWIDDSQIMFLNTYKMYGEVPNIKITIDKAGCLCAKTVKKEDLQK